MLITKPTKPVEISGFYSYKEKNIQIELVHLSFTTLS